MLDKSFHRKVQSRKIFTHRESFETIIAKTEEKLSKVSVPLSLCVCLCVFLCGIIKWHVARQLPQYTHTHAESEKQFILRIRNVACLVLLLNLQCRLEYKQCHLAHRQNPSQHSLTEYIDAHNAYVQQLHATNGMLEAYHGDTLPQLMQELEEIHNDLCNIVADSLQQGADVIAAKVSLPACPLPPFGQLD